MGRFIETLKFDIATLTTIATFVAAIVGGAIAVESRYVKASEFEQFKVQQTKSMNYVVQQQQSSLLDYKKDQMEDKIFELQMIQHPTTAQKALLHRYQNRLNDINGELSRVHRLQIPTQ